VGAGSIPISSPIPEVAKEENSAKALSSVHPSNTNNTQSRYKPSKDYYKNIIHYGVKEGKIPETRKD